MERNFDYGNRVSFPPHHLSQQGVSMRIHDLCSEYGAKLSRKSLLHREIIGRPTRAPVKQHQGQPADVPSKAVLVLALLLASLPTDHLVQFTCHRVFPLYQLMQLSAACHGDGTTLCEPVLRVLLTNRWLLRSCVAGVADREARAQ